MTAAALHEIQHVVQLREGLPMGSAPQVETAFPEMYKQGLGQDPNAISQHMTLLEQEMGLKTPHTRAAFDAYRRSAGEVEAENVRNRRGKGYKYLAYPEDTEDVGRGIQIIRHPKDFDEANARGRGFASGGAADYEAAADKILHGKKDQLDQVYPGEHYDDNATYAAEKRITRPMEQTAPMPTYDKVPDQPYAVKMAGGGNPYAPQPKGSDIAGYMSRKMIHKSVNPGMLKSPVPGRTDKLPISVPSGSYVVPADTVSALGQGNSDAGSNILSKMFKTGPLGIGLAKNNLKGHIGSAARIGTMKMPKGSKIGFADGGATPPVDVVAAGGEFILHPDQVMQVGGGDLDKGHEILDAFVKHVRRKTISTLKKLPGPAKD
jgi:hypothetical protein